MMGKSILLKPQCRWEKLTHILNKWIFQQNKHHLYSTPTLTAYEIWTRQKKIELEREEKCHRTAHQAFPSKYREKILVKKGYI